MKLHQLLKFSILFSLNITIFRLKKECIFFFKKTKITLKEGDNHLSSFT